MQNFKDFASEERWNERFDLPLHLYLHQVADTNMRLFMGMPFEEDYQVTDHRMPKTHVRTAKMIRDDIEIGQNNNLRI